MRNVMVINGKVFNFRHIIDTVKLHITSWFKYKWPDCINSVLDAVRFPNAIQVPLKAKAAKKAILWKIPPLDALKLMSVRGKHRPASIGGVLRDCKVEVKVVFSKAIGVAYSNTSELLVVRKIL
ncbi:hypothetical protein CRYUN_Cryun23aG0028100 [Craigia yunnanensis]